MFGSRSKHGSSALPSPGGVGLVNLGNTCYLNSSLQALASLQSLADLLPDASASSAAAPHSSPALQALLADSHPTGLPVTAALAAVLGRMRKRHRAGEKRQLVNPKELIRAIGKKNSDFSDVNEQQDAHELLRIITDACFMEELDLIKQLRPPVTPVKRRRRRGTAGSNGLLKPGAASSSASSSSSSSSSSDEDDGCASHTSTPAVSPNPASPPALSPWIEGVFGGKLSSIIVCDECKHVSISREPFMDLSLPVVQEDKPRKRGRLRRLLGVGASTESSSSASSSASTSGPRSASVSLPASRSETEGSESDTSSSAAHGSAVGALADEERLRRRRSLDPALLRRGRANFAKPKAPTSEDDEHAAHVRKLLAPVPPVIPPTIAHLRISHPTPGAATTIPIAESEHGGTGLFDLLRAFTAVDELDGDNMLKCRRCWKIAHPTLVRPRQRPRSDTIRQGPVSPIVERNGLGLDQAAPPSSQLEIPRIETIEPSPEASSADLALGDKSVSVGGLAPSPELSEATLSDGGADADAESVASGGGASRRGSLVSGDELSGLSRQASMVETDESGPAAHAPAVAFALPSSAPSAAVRAPSAVPPKAERFILRRAHKRYLIDTLPKVLVLHLKRFQQTRSTGLFGTSVGASSFSTLKKLEDFVSFPTTLDMAPFLAPKLRPGSRKARPWQWLPPHEPKPPPKPANPPRRPDNARNHSWLSWLHQHAREDGELPQTRYRLKAVVAHSGSMSNGHYVAMTLAKPALDIDKPSDEPTWQHFSDETVRAATTSEVLGTRAYILLWELMS